MSQPLSPQDDGALVEQHLQGRRDASETLYERFHPRILRYCRRITDPRLAEDLAQETMCRALAHLPGFDTRRPLWPWLKTIAFHLARDTAQKRSREVLSLPREEAVYSDSYAAVEEGPLLAQGMIALTQAQRNALYLRYVEGWEPARVAEFLGVGAHAVKQLLHRARERLRIEYTRLSDTSLGLMLVPLRWARRLLEPLAEKVKRAAAKMAPYAGPGTDGFQVAAGIAAAILFLGPGPPANAGIPPPDPHAEGPFALTAPGPRGTDLNGHDGMRPGGGAPETPGTGSARKQQDVQAHEAAGDKARGSVHPNRETEQPEDTSVLSVTGSSSSSGSEEQFALGMGNCNNAFCHPVLFRSTDAGTSWERLPGEGLVGNTLLLPPGYPTSDPRLFISGQEGLHVSEDGGASFHPAPLAGGPQAAGPVAMSPAFNSGDPTILIGARALLRYRDDTRTVEPVATSTPPGQLEPAYSPAYGSDRTIFLGATAFDPLWGTTGSTVYRCVDGVCTPATLEGQDVTPKLRVAPDFANTGRVYAYTQKALFRSVDGGAAFEPLPLPWFDEILSDLTVTRETLIASTTPMNETGKGGAYLSTDGGSSWARLESPLLTGGVRGTTVAGDRLIAALYGQGLACSPDGGLTWAPRCPR